MDFEGLTGVQKKILAAYQDQKVLFPPCWGLKVDRRPRSNAKVLNAYVYTKGLALMMFGQGTMLQDGRRMGNG